MKTFLLPRLFATVIALAGTVIARAGITTIETNPNAGSTPTYLFGQSLLVTNTNTQTRTITRPGFGTDMGDIAPSPSRSAQSLNLLNRLPNDNSGSSQFLTSQNSLGQTTIATLTGSITLKRANGPDIIVDAGKGIVLKADGTPVIENGKPVTIASLAANDAALTQSLLSAVKEVAASSTSSSLGTLAAIVKVVSEALPNQASTIVQNAVAGLAEGKQITGEASTLNLAVGAVIQAASQGSGATVASLTTTATQAANSVGLSVTPATSATVLNPVLTPVVTETITLPASPS